MQEILSATICILNHLKSRSIDLSYLPEKDRYRTKMVEGEGGVSVHTSWDKRVAERSAPGKELATSW